MGCAMVKTYDTDQDGCLDVEECRRLVISLSQASKKTDATRVSTSCQKGHMMQMFITPQVGYNCYQCGVPRKQGEMIWWCKDCTPNVFECVACSKTIQRLSIVK